MQFNEEGKRRTEEEIGDRQEVARPDLLGMSMNERPPRLSSWPCGTNLPHVLLNGAFRNVNAQLEELTTNAFCSEDAVVPCHLLDQGHSLLGYSRLERSCPRLVLPKEFEALTMPARASSLAGR